MVHIRGCVPCVPLHSHQCEGDTSPINIVEIDSIQQAPPPALVPATATAPAHVRAPAPSPARPGTAAVASVPIDGHEAPPAARAAGAAPEVHTKKLPTIPAAKRSLPARPHAPVAGPAVRTPSRTLAGLRDEHLRNGARNATCAAHCIAASSRFAPLLPASLFILLNTRPVQNSLTGRYQR